MLTKGFWMKETEVTQAEWQAVMENSPSAFSLCGSNCPVEQVSWWDAIQFCNTLSSRQGLTLCYSLSGCSGTAGGGCGEEGGCRGDYMCSSISENPGCTGYRLPTEAEWERAYRAGTTTAFYNGDLTNTDCRDANLDAIGWYCGNANATHPVSDKAANEWGLHDMSGNVYEWCWDWFDTYSLVPQSDPKGPSSGGPFRVIRGGSWFFYAQYCRAASRDFLDPRERTDLIGLRVVRSH